MKIILTIGRRQVKEVDERFIVAESIQADNDFEDDRRLYNASIAVANRLEDVYVPSHIAISTFNANTHQRFMRRWVEKLKYEGKV